MKKAITLIVFSLIAPLYGASSSSSFSYGGPLYRASNNNKIDQATSEDMQKDFFKKSTLSSDKTTIPKVIQKYGPNVLKDVPVKDIQSGFYSRSLFDRFLMSEYLFANLALHMGISLNQDVDTTMSQKIDPKSLEGDNYPFGLHESEGPVKLQDLAARAMASTFYARQITAGNVDVGHRNIDTFYGVIVVNESQHYVSGEVEHGSSSERISDGRWEYTTIQIGDTNEKSKSPDSNVPLLVTSYYERPSVSYGKEDGFVDKWIKRPFAKQGTDSRSLSLILQGKDSLNEGKQLNYCSVQDEAVSGSAFLIEVTDQASSSNIPLIKLHKMDSEDNNKVAYTQPVIQDSNMSKFFSSGQYFPWAVVVHVRNVPNVLCLNGATTNCKSEYPEVVVQGLARLNPIDFPLYYSGASEGSSDPYLMSNFSTKDLIEAPSKLYMAVSGLSSFPVHSSSSTIGLNENLAQRADKKYKELHPGNNRPNYSIGYDLSSKCPSTATVFARGVKESLAVLPRNFGQAKFDGILSQQFFTQSSEPSKLTVPPPAQTDFETGTFLGALKNNVNILRYSYITSGILENLTPKAKDQEKADKANKDKLFISLINSKGGGTTTIKGSHYIPSTPEYKYAPFINVHTKPMVPVGLEGGSNE